MGWASGSRLFRDVWRIVRQYVAEDQRKNVAKQVMDRFEDRDCDTLMECFDDEWPEVEDAYCELHPDFERYEPVDGED